MTPIKEPRPRSKPALWQPFDWPVRRVIALRPSPPVPSSRFSDVMAYRRSERRMSPPNIGQVVDVLRFSSALRTGWSYQGVVRHNAPPILEAACMALTLSSSHTLVPHGCFGMTVRLIVWKH